MGMVVRTNVMAMNANRQLGMNNNQVSKSLEKLSSGFRINRAGDDAAGLAISEKMKAQIKGLDQASSNSQDGISLVQTAEGALTEVHSMLNRMVELATKSANGTIQDPVDREAIQSEVNALLEEIDRIGDSTNFNGINLLDGTMGAGGPSFTITSVNEGDMAPATASTLSKTISGTDVTVKDASGNNSKIKFVSGTGTAAPTASWTGDTLTVTVGSTYKSDGVAGVSAADINTAIAGATGTANGDVSIAYTGNVTVANLANASGFGTTGTATAGGTPAAPAANSVTTLDFTGKTAADLDGLSFKYDGQTYTFVSDATKVAGTKNAIDISAANIADTAIAAAVAGKLTAGAGDTVAAAGSTVTISKVAASGDKASKVTLNTGLTLQVGDTGDSFNMVTVSVDDMRSAGLGIAGLDVSNADAARASIQTIKDAINKVSTNRANLGALQNRLEYTINNLDVASENMTAANSRIRDTDMAKEMMEYTKVNVLTQAAQAMLAQANQQPQSILQLLQ